MTFINTYPFFLLESENIIFLVIYNIKEYNLVGIPTSLLIPVILYLQQCVCNVVLTASRELHRLFFTFVLKPPKIRAARLPKSASTAMKTLRKLLNFFWTKSSVFNLKKTIVTFGKTQKNGLD